ncbi:NAD(P)-dependent dehydrogenase (short-subunit alcohol dehydrogenase family) [Nocardia transvalensis]|uniref:NAD(P)-dependent dehydrogenase (Short-subunit alcohol dehydrogenase family) n=1 Tax=Nocardia transvalensis TaxID=37333 RepID=A0A7W9UKX7_9NOCA|nr:SDR family NAD(P)-dependent oxidoreductase [Nocardia transvalensis]MBB5916984.1 NAD(P)-dependent dehydrogenase (short-subunit alcohol dehydrogenase family) [Nocardia transvalensis]
MKTILITGATSGIGLAAARQIAAGGDRLVLVGRNPDKLAAAADQVRAAGPGAVDTAECDISSQDSVRRLASTVLENYPRVDVLANNAGGFFGRYTKTGDGVESTFATNHLGGYLLTELLLERLLHSAPARIVFTSSVMHYGTTVDLGDLGCARGYSGQKAYSRSKLANLLYARELSRRLAGTGVTANAFHPGAVSTGIWDFAPWFAKPVMELAKRVFMVPSEEGGRRLTALATDPDLAAVTGCYFQKGRVKAPSRVAQDDELGTRLSAACADLVGLPAPSRPR